LFNFVYYLLNILRIIQQPYCKF